MAAKDDGRDKQDLIEQVRRLEAKIRDLESSPQSAGAAEPGLAEGLVAALGRLVPGLAKLIEVGAQMPQFHQQLAAIDDEIKRKFKDQPIRASAVTFARNLERRASLGIPPSVRRSRSRPDSADSSAQKPRGGYRRQTNPKVRLSPESPATLHVDVFDEGRDLVVLADAPGLAADRVTAALEGDSLLVITIDDPRRPGDHRIALPSAVSGPPQVSLGNGILKIRLTKKGR
jgi:HSP20 family molecular chaperone IbpA